MFLAAQARLGPEFELSTEIHSLKRTAVLPQGVRYLSVEDSAAIEESVRKADLVFLIGDTPVMDQWGLAWLLSPRIDSEWAHSSLQKIAGASAGRLPIGVNLVNEIWKEDVEVKKAWGALLDRLIERYDAQVFFFCNESREGDYFDQAAATEVREQMGHPSIMVPRRYYEPDQMISLLSCMQLTLSQRYHFTLFSILADVYPISIQRGQKMEGLNQELDLPFVGDMTHLDEKSIEREVEAVLNHAEAKMEPLRVRRKHLEARAMNNLSLIRY